MPANEDLFRFSEALVLPTIGASQRSSQIDSTKMNKQEGNRGIPGLFDLLPDGTVLRSEFVTPSVPASLQPECFSRDVLVEASTNLQVRLFLPCSKSAASNKSKLPLIVYFHGGGFCMCSAKTIFIHNFCAEMAKATAALVVSVDYRLAPEHRLPAAYQDAALVLQWLSRHSLAKSDRHDDHLALDLWISSFADFSNCFLMGENSGANILHHLMLRRSKTAADPSLLTINGVILVHPFFGGEERTPSEIKLSRDDFVAPVELLEEFWRCCLPVGADRDHPFSNPFISEEDLSEIELPRLLVVVGGKNSLQDRQVDYFNLLKKSNKDVLLLFLKNARHGFEFLAGQTDQANILLEFIAEFMSGNWDPKKLRRSASLVLNPARET